MKNKTKKSKYNKAYNPDELAELLGINSDVDKKLMIYKARLSSLAVKAIKDSKMSINEIVKISGVARSKVSAIKNGALSGMSSDLFIKVIIATGANLNFKMAA